MKISCATVVSSLSRKTRSKAVPTALGMAHKAIFFIRPSLSLFAPGPGTAVHALSPEGCGDGGPALRKSGTEPSCGPLGTTSPGERDQTHLLPETPRRPFGVERLVEVGREAGVPLPFVKGEPDRAQGY